MIRKQYNNFRDHVPLFLCCALLPVIIGGLVYLFWRPDSIAFLGWLNVIGLDRSLVHLRIQVAPLYIYLPEWVIYSLPNGLWAFSYAFIITALWWPTLTALKYLWLATIPLVGLGYEVMQYLGIIPGVFCYTDLVLCFIGVVSGMTVAVKLNKPLAINI